jgi:two-component system, response regulator YesN
MLYKVFLVEDEIVTREGIRDNVDWKSAGFEFCGEAPDGEIALPLIEASQPDLLITDIKMPFMDGLQLCKIIREYMPWVKIIILSGHDEFNYAQAAIKLGVTEYLLKPVSVKDLHSVLQRTTETLDRERKEREDLKRLREQVDGSLVLLREKFLLRLVLGGVPSAEAIEQSQQFGLNLVANYHQVLLIKIESPQASPPFDYQDYQSAGRIISALVSSNKDVFLVQKDLEEIILLIKGESPEQLNQDGAFLAELIQTEVEPNTTCRVKIGIGSPQQRLADIHHSFAEASAKLQSTLEGAPLPGYIDEDDPIDRVKLDQAALEHYLKAGAAQDFDAFFDTDLLPIGHGALRSPLVKHYLFLDIILTTAQFITDLGGNADQVLPEIRQVENLLARARTIDQVRAETRAIITSALAFRDGFVDNQQAITIHRAMAYIDENVSNPDLSLSRVAAKANLSPSHFSVVFSQVTGETYRDYLTRIRIEHAKELLRTTNLQCSEVAYQCGYNDPHYFSYIFKKNTGVSPLRFRLQPKGRK